MNDIPIVGDLCYAHRILESLGGKHCKSVNRMCKVVSLSKVVSLGIDLLTFLMIL